MQHYIGIVVYIILFVLPLCKSMSNVTNKSDIKYRISLYPSQSQVVLAREKAALLVVCEYLVGGDLCISVKPRHDGIVRILNKELYVYGNESGAEQHIGILGLHPGRVFLDLNLRHADRNNSEIGPLTQGYEIIVVARNEIIRDAFAYITLVMQLMTLLVLGFRMRLLAIREVLFRPCSLIVATVCQVLLKPLMILGVSMVLSLSRQAVIGLLLMGCCPTGMLSPVFAVLQRSHVELAIVLLLVQTVISFGAFPLWLFAYGNLLGLSAHQHVNIPYFYVAGCLMVTAGPIILGISLQRCFRQALPQLDKAVQPICGLMSLIAFTVGAFQFYSVWTLLTWRHLLGAGLVTFGGALLGALITLLLQLKLPFVKSVAIITCVHNTLLAMVVVQTSYPVPESGLMSAMLIAVEFLTICVLYVAYIPHVFLWLCVPGYRACHDGIGLGALFHCIGNQVVKHMVKAGEISFASRQQSSKDGASGVDDKSSTVPAQSPAFVCTSSWDNICNSQQSLLNANETPMNYFATPEGSMVSRKKSDKDSLSIDYELIMNSDYGRMERSCTTASLTGVQPGTPMPGTNRGVLRRSKRGHSIYSDVSVGSKSKLILTKENSGYNTCSTTDPINENTSIKSQEETAFTAPQNVGLPEENSEINAAQSSISLNVEVSSEPDSCERTAQLDNLSNI